ncbi:MAG: transcriptional regulator [Burkholderiales bacterium PBB5]|nr:MAG: transcriptional regulator [Burkholderiales bacterium PBB5]
MSKTARLYKIEMLIRLRGHVSFAQMIEALEVSPATLKRDLEYLRDQLGAPISYDRDANGYRFDSAGAQAWRGAEPKHELPGLWFSERELYALLMAHQLGPGGESQTKALMKRVKIIGALRRPVASECFERAGEALMHRRRLHLSYLTRGRGEVGEREVSPQRLVHYKSTWYLDAWCHSRERLLRFALDAVQTAKVLDSKAKDVALRQVQAEMDAGYGIFAGGQRQEAVLLFSTQAAPWISHEEWHPEQQGRWLDDGRWELRLPYVDETELVMDLLRQGEQVQVLAPASLQQAVRRKLAAALAVYG